MRNMRGEGECKHFFFICEKTQIRTSEKVLQSRNTNRNESCHALIEIIKCTGTNRGGYTLFCKHYFTCFAGTPSLLPATNIHGTVLGSF